MCKLRNPWARHKLGKVPRNAFNDPLRRSGSKITKEPIVNVTISGATSSIQNREEKRDSEKHQTSEGKRWYFGTRAQISANSRTKLIHNLAAAASVHDREVLQHLPHGEETRMWNNPG